MPVWACFSYPADVPPGTRNRGAAQRAVPGLRRMPSTCFSYSVSAPVGIGNRGAAQPDGSGVSVNRGNALLGESSSPGMFSSSSGGAHAKLLLQLPG